MTTLPTPRHAGALLGALVLCLVQCDGRTLPGEGEDGIGDGDGDGESGDGDGDGDVGDGDGDVTGDGDGDPAITCTPIVGDLLVTDETPLEQIACIEKVTGDITIGPTTELLDLSALGSLREVEGTLTIVGNLLLNDLDGLDALERVSWLHVRRNRNMSNLLGVDALLEVDRITVASNDGMTSLAGLPTGLRPTLLEVAENQLLASLDGLPLFLISSSAPLAVEIDQNPSLIDLGGLSDCCAAHTLAVTLTSNNALVDLGGLEQFNRLERLVLHDNVALTSLDGLDSLIDVHTLDIDYDHCIPNNDASLVSLAGAPNLSTVSVLRIEWVGSLTNLDGLDGLASLAKLQVRSNALLDWDAVVALSEQTSPLVLDICGGVGGPDCEPESCPTF